MFRAQASPALLLLSYIVPIGVLLAATYGVALQSGLLDAPPADASLFTPQTVTIAPRAFSYRADGAYSQGNAIIDPPMAEVSEQRPLTIMKYQVTLADYNACVADSACRAPEALPNENTNIPVTGVDFDDAQAYAKWLSQKTGEVWRLPTDEQLAFAAGKSFPDDALGLDPANKNPALRWLAEYDREAAEKRNRDTTPRPAGGYGTNEFGLADFGGNVSEWTTTCHRRVALNSNGGVERIDPICGVYITVGNHRSPMSSFVRNPKSGGCSVGTPPANLGFRLVRDERWYAALLKKLNWNG